MRKTLDIIYIICAIPILIYMLVFEPSRYAFFKGGWMKYFLILVLVTIIITSWMDLKGKFKDSNLRSAEKFYGRGLDFSTKGDLNEAISNYKMALNMDSDFAPARNALGYAFFLKGELNISIKHFKKVIKINPNSSSAHSILGYALAEAGELDEAILEFRRALELEPDNINAREALEKALADIKNKSVYCDVGKNKPVEGAYSNDRYNFSIKQPEGWRINTTKLPPEMLVHFTDPRGGGINIMAGPTYKAQESIEDLENLAIRNVHNLNGEMKSLKRIKVNGVDAVEAIYTAMGAKIKKIGFVKDDVEYVISCAIKHSLFSEYETIFDECIQSFKFNKN